MYKWLDREGETNVAKSRLRRYGKYRFVLAVAEVHVLPYSKSKKYKAGDRVQVQ